MKIIIVSPHLDDAVLSCSHLMQNAVERYKEVLVITCFTVGDRKAAAHYEKRRCEDAQALNYLGVSWQHLGFIDAPFRNSCYNSFSTILFHHSSEEQALICSLRERLSAIIEEFKPSEVYFPLGIGGHVDHHATFESALFFLNDKRFICLFYEDLPYAHIPAWREIRMQRMGSNKKPVDSVHLHCLLSQLPHPFLRNYMVSKEDRELSDRKYAQELQSLIIETDLRVAFDRKQEFLASVMKKTQAIVCYTTEIPHLFDNHFDLIKEFAAYPETCWTTA